MKKYCYDYPMPAVTVDAIIIDKENKNKILLIERKNNPHKGMWALPGGFIEIDENLEDSIKREVLEETSLENIEFVQFKAFGDVGRDPRGRTIVVVFYGFCENPEKAIAGDDANTLKWFPINDLPALAFDHKKIITEFLNQHSGF